jgi:hypothetical protein
MKIERTKSGNFIAWHGKYVAIGATRIAALWYLARVIYRDRTA